MKRVAFLQFGALGDILMATAICEELRRQRPDDHITWICFDCYRSAIANNPHIDDYIAWPLNPDHSRDEQELWTGKVIKGYAEQAFDEIIAPQCYPDHDWEHKKGVHLLDQMFEYAGMESPAFHELVFKASAREQQWAHAVKESYNEPIVTCNIASNTNASIWTADQYAELERLLSKVKIEKK